MKLVDRCAPSLRAVTRPPALPSLVLLLATCAAAPPALAQVGHEYWLAWPETGDATGEDPRYDLGAQLVVLATEGTTRVRVTGPGLDTTVTARPGSPGFVELDRGRHQVNELDRVVNQGIRLRGLGCSPFGLLLRVPGSGSSVADDVARLLPRAMLGRRYYPVSALGMAEFVVVGTEDGTLVTIDDPTCVSPAPFTLDEGEAFLHRCEGGPDGGDVTGTIVEASAPVAVVSGSASSRVLAVRRGGESEIFWDFADVLLEGNWPASMLGRTHVHVPFRKDSPDAVGDAVRLVAGCPTSRTWVETEDDGSWLFDVSAEGQQGYLGATGSHPQGEILPGSAVITGTRPIQVAAYTTGISNAGLGDPSLTLLDAERNWRREAIAWLPSGYEHSLGIAIARGAEGSVRIDGARPSGSWRLASPSASHVWLRVDGVPDGEHRITASEPFTVQVSGYSSGGRPGAYSYPAVGLRDDGRGDFRVEHEANLCASACPGSCFDVATPPGFTEADWSNGEVGTSIELCPNGLETVTVSAVDSRGCRVEGEVTLLVQGDSAPPEIEGPESACLGDCVELVAPANAVSYRWSTGGTEREETVCSSGDVTVEVEVTASNGCSRTISHDLRVLEAPTMGDVSVIAPEPCAPLLSVEWDEAEWPSGDGGVYHVYRRPGGCAPVGDASWELVASNLTVLSWLDEEAGGGTDWSYLVVAEADDAPSDCNPGPSFGGSTGSACATPEGVQAPGPPPTPTAISPWLRVGSVERPSLNGPLEAVTVSWFGAPLPNADDTVEFLRGEDARVLWPQPREATAQTWRDTDAGAEPLLFYRVRHVDPCGNSVE